MPAAPFDQPELKHVTPRVTAALPTWDGTRFDLPWTFGVLYRGPVPRTSVVSKELVGALPGTTV